MRILVDILHPAHVHFFRHFIAEVQERGHEVRVTARRKDVTLDLLERYGIPYTTLSAIGERRSDLLLEQAVRLARLGRIVREFRPQVLMGIMGATIAPLGRLLRVPSLVFYGTENARLTNGVVYRTCTRYITPEAYRQRLGAKHVTYRGFHEQAYLSAKRFTPDESVREELGLEPDDRYAILRFVSWQASHDIGHAGLSFDLKMRAVEELERRVKVFVSSERPLPPEIEHCRFPLPPERLHHALAFADLLYGESATLASEAAMLGTPGIYVDDEGRGFTDALERDFGLVHNFDESPRGQEASLERALELIDAAGSKAEAKRKAERLHRECDDPVQVMLEHALAYDRK